MNAPRHRCTESAFTLIELLVVLVIIGVVVSLVTLALPRGQSRLLQSEGEKLAALFDLARAQSTARHRVYHWRADATGYRFSREDDGKDVPLSEAPLDPQRWPWDALGQSFSIDGSSQAQLVFPGEPVLPPVTLWLQLGEQRGRLFTDGAAPFQFVLQTTTTP